MNGGHQHRMMPAYGVLHLFQRCGADGGVIGFGNAHGSASDGFGHVGKAVAEHARAHGKHGVAAFEQALERSPQHQHAFAGAHEHVFLRAQNGLETDAYRLVKFKIFRTHARWRIVSGKRAGDVWMHGNGTGIERHGRIGLETVHGSAEGRTTDGKDAFPPMVAFPAASRWEVKRGRNPPPVKHIKLLVKSFRHVKTPAVPCKGREGGGGRSAVPCPERREARSCFPDPALRP